MKRFIIKFIGLAFIVVCILVIVFIFSYLILLNVSFMVPSNKTILVLGTSSTATSIDDTIFSHSINISRGADHKMYEYIKLRKFLNENTSIDTVLLSFDRSIMSDYFLFDEDHIFHAIPLHISLMGREELSIFLKRRIFYNATIQSPRKNAHAIFKFLLKGNISYADMEIGGHNKLYRNKLCEDILRREGFNDSPDETPTIYQLQYLLKINALCKEKGIKLILISAPMYMPEKYGSHEKLVSYYNDHLKGIPWFDYSGFSLSDSDYADIFHLNYEGAKIFSQYLEDHYDEIFLSQ